MLDKKYDKGDKYLRRAIYEVYGGKCKYCGKALTPDEIQIDHIIPVKP